MDIKIKNVYYRVENMQVVNDFYSRILGLKPQFVDGNNWSQYKIGDNTLALAGPVEAPEELYRGASTYRGV